MTTIYLIRHSTRMKKEYIENYKTSQDDIIKNEKIILDVEGEKRAEILSKEQELQNIDVVYASNCVRTLQTAKYLLESQNLKVTIDERLNEKRTGKPNEDKHPNWFNEQYIDENYKTEGGESQKEVRKRLDEVIQEILKKYQDKRIAVYSHGHAILFYILKYSKLVTINDKKLCIEFNNKIIFNKRINAPEVFKLTFDDKNLKNIELIEFEDLPYKQGV